MKCPKCGHERAAEDDANAPSHECPACGVNYAKYTLSRQLGEAARQAQRQRPPASAPPSRQEVVITGVDIPFGKLVLLMFAAGAAAIPAGLLLIGLANLMGLLSLLPAFLKH